MTSSFEQPAELASSISGAANTSGPPDYRSTGSDRQLNAAILKQMSDAVISIDAVGTIESVNPAFEQMFGVTADQAIGKGFGEVMLAREGFAEFNDVLIDAIFHKKETLARDIGIDRQGERRHLSVRANFLVLPGRAGAGDGGEAGEAGVVAVVSDQTERIALLERQSDYAQALIMIVFCLSIGTIVTAIGLQTFDIDALFGSASHTWRLIIWAGLLSIALPCLVYLRRTRFPLSDFGLTLDGWRRSLAESGVIIAVGLVALTLLAIFLDGRSGDPAAPLFDWKHIAGIGAISYVLHSFMQEFVARGVLQGTLMRVLAARHDAIAILSAAFIFASLHAIVGLKFVIVTFFVSLLLGYVYNRHRTLIGVTLIHAVLGEAIFVLGLN